MLNNRVSQSIVKIDGKQNFSKLSKFNIDPTIITQEIKLQFQLHYIPYQGSFMSNINLVISQANRHPKQ